MSGSELKCDHKGCRCGDVPVERGEKRFCSEHCAEREMSNAPEPPVCLCGHPDCAA